MQSLTVVSDRACLLINQNVYVFHTGISINSTGVAEGLPCNARDRKVTGSSLNREVFFNYWSTGVDFGSSGKAWHRVSRAIL